MLKALRLLIIIMTAAVLANGQTTTGVVSIELDEKQLVIPCPKGQLGCEGIPSKDFIVDVRVGTGTRVSRSEIRYEVTRGKVIGIGKTVSWDLSNQLPGTYHIIATQFVDGKQTGESKTATINIFSEKCNCHCDCPNLTISSSSNEARNGDLIVFSVNAEGGSFSPSYYWNVENGEIISGQETPTINVKVKGNSAKKEVTASVKLAGFGPYCTHFCSKQVSASAKIID
ncbi:MAG: hypothetical protein ACJ72Z_14420 [Pyrinomonadaceae bacterium]